jgi:hypothetical protein
MRKTFLILILFYGKLAFAATLTIAIVPPGPTIKPDMRKVIGHVVALINCSNIQRSTSITTSLHGAYMQSGTEIKKFLNRYRDSVKIFSYQINNKSCAGLVSFDNFYRDSNGLHFSPFLDPLKEYENFNRGISSTPGGTGASYAVALLKLTGAKIPFDNCKERLFGQKFETARSVMKCLSKSSGARTL